MAMGMAKKPKSGALTKDADRLATALIRVELLKACGIRREEIENKPLIGIVNSWNDLLPGHLHLRELARSVRDGVLAAGGVPLEFNTIAPCDGYSNGLPGMRYVLPMREIIADAVESMVSAHGFDGLVFLSGCDKIVPAQLMAAARLDLPSIFVTGGPMLPFNAFAPKGTPPILSMVSCPGPGACSGMGTAVSMQCLVEAMGMSLPGSAATHAVHSEKFLMGQKSGMRVVEMVEEELSCRKILTEGALRNGLVTTAAAGCSTNVVIHLLALAEELGLKLSIDDFDNVGREVPHILGVYPSGPYFLLDVYRAGGIPVMLKKVVKFLKIDALTVTGRTIGEEVEPFSCTDDDVIRDLENPYHPDGGIAILRGSLAPDGAVVKTGSIPESMLKFTGPAHVYESEAAAIEGGTKGEFGVGEVIIIRNEGPVGGPGMPELLTVTELLFQLEIADKSALITDGRFSGFSRGPCVGHVSPEAFVGGPLSLIEDGDIITIDIPNRDISFNVSEEILKKRAEKRKPEKRSLTGALSKYAALVSQAYRGCVTKVEDGK